jgi:uncharacterized membrane protein YjfL (UPF0719 family)
MSGDEVFLWFISAVVGVACWLVWYVPTLTVSGFGRSAAPRRLLRFTPLLAAALLWLVLVNWASADVVGAYRWLYLTFGAAWVGFGVLWFSWFGLSLRDDVLERGNPAAAWALAGAILGLTACFAGANIGNGPGWWVVLFTAGLATATWLGLWLLLERLAHPSEPVTIDRGPSAGMRLGALLTSAGMILGRAAAGDWLSVGATVRDFVLGAWPALLLCLGAAVVETRLRPDADQPRRPPLMYGLVPSAAYLVLAAAWLVTAGWWM